MGSLVEEHPATRAGEQGPSGTQRGPDQRVRGIEARHGGFWPALACAGRGGS